MEIKKAANEYTDKEFLSWLKKKFKKKKNKNKSPFTMNDVNQYCLKGKLPEVYGGNTLEVTMVEGVLRVIRVCE